MRESSPDVPMSPEADRLRRKFARREAREERQLAIDRGEVEVINDGEILSQKHTYVSPPRRSPSPSFNDEEDERIFFSESSSPRQVYPNPRQMSDSGESRKVRRLSFDEDEDDDNFPKTLPDE